MISIFAYTVGNVVVFVNMLTRFSTYVQGLDTGGVGCLCVHPNKTKFAVGGRGHQARIFVYSYPDMQVNRPRYGDYFVYTTYLHIHLIRFTRNYQEGLIRDTLVFPSMHPEIG
jgi:hypothetical protein